MRKILENCYVGKRRKVLRKTGENFRQIQESQMKNEEMRKIRKI